MMSCFGPETFKPKIRPLAKRARKFSCKEIEAGLDRPAAGIGMPHARDFSFALANTPA
jgi:hypothetical protein